MSSVPPARSFGDRAACRRHAFHGHGVRQVQGVAVAVAVVVEACPVCDGDRFRKLPTPGRWIGTEVFDPLRGKLGLVDCRDCGLAFVNPRPAAPQLASFYNGNTYDCHETAGSASSGQVAEFLMSRIEPQLPADAPRTLLDYGAGGGGFLLDMRARGWDVRGFEPGLRGRAACQVAGLDVTGDAATLPSSAFGLVTMHHVFEHLEDPGDALSIVRRVLAPDGRLFIEVPNLRSLRARLALPPLSRRLRVDERFRAFPIHLAYYSVDTLTRLLARHGWIVQTSFTVGMGLDEYLVAPPRPAPRSQGASAPPTAAAARPPASARPGWLRGLRRRVRDAYLGMGIGENLAVIARPA